MNGSPVRLMALVALLSASPSFSQAPSLEDLRARCEDARERRIAPLRAAAIEDCATRRRSTLTRADCERLYADFGQGGATVTDARRPPMFNDLPECLEYFEAQDARRSTGSRR